MRGCFSIIRGSSQVLWHLFCHEQVGMSAGSPPSLFRSCLRFLNDGKFRFQSSPEPFIMFWEVKLKGESDTASDAFGEPR